MCKKYYFVSFHILKVLKLLRPGICSADGFKNGLKKLYFLPHWMQALGMHPTDSTNNHSCPKLRWVSGMNYRPLGKVKGALFHQDCTVLGIPFSDSFPERGKYTRLHRRTFQELQR